jgi:CHASE3 domain sensor protein
MSFIGARSGKGLLVSLIIGFIAAEAIVAAGFLSLLHFKTSANWVSQSQHVLLELERMVNTVTGAETNQRAYLITGSDEYLPSYRNAMDSLDDHLQRIGSLTRRDAVQQNRVAYLVNQIEQRSEQMDDAIITRRTKGLPYAKSVVASNQQSGTMDAIHEVVGQMRAEETRLLERHRAESEAWAITTGSFAAVFFFLTAIVFTLCGLLMKMALSSQAQAERLLQTFSGSSTAHAAR